MLAVSSSSSSSLVTGLLELVLAGGIDRCTPVKLFEVLNLHRLLRLCTRREDDTVPVSVSDFVSVYVSV